MLMLVSSLSYFPTSLAASTARGRVRPEESQRRLEDPHLPQSDDQD